MTDLLIVNGAPGVAGSSIAAISARRARSRVAPPSLRLPSIDLSGNPIPAALVAALTGKSE